MKLSPKIRAALFVLSPAFQLFGTVADLQALQEAHPSVAYQYTFEGVTEDGQLAQKVGGLTPALKQAASEARRRVDFLTPGYDASTRCAVFSAFVSGAKGETLCSASPVVLAPSGAIEFLVRLGSANREHAMIAGTASTGECPWLFLGYRGTQAVVAIGENTPHILFGEGTKIPYSPGYWYYVAIVWTVAGGNVTLNAWVSPLNTPSHELAQTIVNAVNPFNGNGEVPLFLGSVDGSQKFADGSLDALAIYRSPLDEAAIASHHGSIIRQ